MPELPEVETVRLGMEKILLGKKIAQLEVRRTDLRVPVTKNAGTLLAGKKCESIIRRGKYIILIFSDNLAAILHLGMSGRIKIFAADQKYVAEKHDHLIFLLEGGERIVFYDPRRFGFFTITAEQLWKKEKPFLNMGPEPLDHWDGADLLAALNKRSMPIKTALLDQSIVAGLGNIYVCEALFCAGISPERRSNSLTAAEAKELCECTKGVLNKALKAGGSTLRDYKKTDGSLGYFQHQFTVYDQEDKPCPRAKCGGKIHRIIQAGRSTYYCPVCQK